MIFYIKTFFLQRCKENRSPNSKKCPVPNGGCRYAFWNKKGSWCHLIGSSCGVLQSAESSKTVIDTWHGEFIFSEPDIYSNKFLVVSS